MKLTEWFPADVKPVRKGAYERKFSNFDYRSYSWWDGEKWSCGYTTVEKAKRSFKAGSVSNLQNLPWRGIVK